MKGSKQVRWLLLFLFIVASGWGCRAKAASFLYDADNVHDGTVGRAYEAHIRFYCYADSLEGAYLESGTLPPGLSFSVDKNIGIIKITGTPTTAGSYTFELKAGSKKTAYAYSQVYTVKIAPSNQLNPLTMKNCEALQEDGQPGDLFYAGELVTVVPTGLSQNEYVQAWKTTGGVNIPTGLTGSTRYYTSANTFYMPAQGTSVSVECVKADKNLGTYNHDAVPGKGADHTCDIIPIASMKLALELGIVNNIGMIEEGVGADETNRRTYEYYNIDLDKDGTVDLKMTEVYAERYTFAGGATCVMEVADGRSVYGTFTVDIPKDSIYAKSDCGLYSKIVFNMGSKEGSGSSGSSASSSSASDCPASASGHKIRAVQAQEPGCETDGFTWHCECTECGEWFWDIEGKTKIANKDSLVLKATGHDWGSWTVVKEATATEDGLQERRCNNNKNHVEQEAIPATGAVPTTEEPATEEPATAEPTTEVSTQPASTEAPSTAAPTQPAETEAPTQSAEPSKNEKSNTGLYIALVAAAVIGGVFAGILIGSKGKTTASSKDTAEGEKTDKAPTSKEK